jgi:hypothetical protein
LSTHIVGNGTKKEITISDLCSNRGISYNEVVAFINDGEIYVLVRTDAYLWCFKRLQELTQHHVTRLFLRSSIEETLKMATQINDVQLYKSWREFLEENKDLL